MEIDFWHLGHIGINGSTLGCSDICFISEIKNDDDPHMLLNSCIEMLCIEIFIFVDPFYTSILGFKNISLNCIRFIMTHSYQFYWWNNAWNNVQLKWCNDRFGVLKSFSVMKRYERYERWIVSSTNLYFSICFNLFFPYLTFALASCHNPHYYVIIFHE